MDELIGALTGASYAGVVKEIAEEFPAAIPKLLQLVQLLRGEAPEPPQTVQVGTGEFVATSTSSFSGFFTLKQTSFLTPRGKFDVGFSEMGVKLVGKDAIHEIPRDAVKHIFNIPTSDRTEAKAAAQRLFVIVLKHALTFGKSQVSVLAIQVSDSVPGDALVFERAIEKSECASATAVDSLLSMHPSTRPSQLALLSTLFGASLTTPITPAFYKGARGSFIKCYHGADEGLLFPTKFGLLFATKPLLFLSHDDIDAMDVSRGGVSFRTFDLNVKLKPPVDGKGKGKSIEFRMLPQEEMEPLKRYVAQCAFRRDQSAPADTGTPTAAAGDGESKPEAAANSAGKIEDGADETAQVVSSKRARPSLPVYNDQESDDDDEDEDDESFCSDSDGSGDDSEDSYSGGSIVVSDYNSDTAGLKRDSSSESSTDDTNSDTEDLGRLGDDDDEDAPLSSLATKRQKTSEE